MSRDPSLNLSLSLSPGAGPSAGPSAGLSPGLGPGLGRGLRARLTVALLVVQVSVLVCLPLLRGARIEDGTVVRVPVAVVDPVDLARGSYVDLDYQLPPAPDETAGSEAYVLLEQPGDADADAWKVTDIIERDEGRLRDADAWLRLPVKDTGEVDTASISSFYTDANTARTLERDLADGGLAELSIDADGDPLLVDVDG